MGIKLDHRHSDKICYKISSGRVPGGLKDPALVLLGGGTFAVAKMPYTGSWYAYDIHTGEEIARFNSEFFEKHIKPNIVYDLIPDPDCTPGGK